LIPPQRRIGSRAVAIVHYTIDCNHWEFRQETGNDVGRDCTVELSENNKWLNHKIEGQIKGTKTVTHLTKKRVLSFPMATKTINYALSSSTPFVLFYVDIVNEIVYFLPIQDYFISHKELFKKLEGNQETLTLHIPISNILAQCDAALVAIAKCTYVDGPGDSLRRHNA